MYIKFLIGNIIYEYEVKKYLLIYQAAIKITSKFKI